MSADERARSSTSPLPLPDQDTAEYWRAASEHRLIARRDEAGRPYHYPRRRVPGSLTESPGWMELSGRGRVYSFTVVHQATSRAFRDRVPYIVALVDLDEGPRVMTNIEAEPGDVRIGLRVRVAWRDPDDHDADRDGGGDTAIALPIFEPDSPT